MKCYTVIDSFEANGYPELWIANYADRDSAVKCLGSLMRRYGIDGDEGKLFSDLLDNGYGFGYYRGGEQGVLFVRGEAVQDSFSKDALPPDEPEPEGSEAAR